MRRDRTSFLQNNLFPLLLRCNRKHHQFYITEITQTEINKNVQWQKISKRIACTTLLGNIFHLLPLIQRGIYLPKTRVRFMHGLAEYMFSTNSPTVGD